jgi:hypothetical protein
MGNAGIEQSLYSLIKYDNVPLSCFFTVKVLDEAAAECVLSIYRNFLQNMP